jgi:hypothetical protein
VWGGRGGITNHQALWTAIIALLLQIVLNAQGDQPNGVVVTAIA